MTTLEHRAKAMSRLADETRAKLDSAFRLADSAFEDQTSDLLALAKDTRDWAEDLGPDAEAWAERIVELAGSAMRLMDSARGSLMLAYFQAERLAIEINKNPA